MWWQDIHIMCRRANLSATLLLCLQISHGITRYRRDEGTVAARSNGGRCRLRRRRIHAGFCFVDPLLLRFICCYIVCRLVCLLPLNSLVVSSAFLSKLHCPLSKLSAGVAAVSYYLCVLIYCLPIRLLFPLYLVLLFVDCILVQDNTIRAR